MIQEPKKSSQPSIMAINARRRSAYSTAVGSRSRVKTIEPKPKLIEDGGIVMFSVVLNVGGGGRGAGMGVVTGSLKEGERVRSFTGAADIGGKVMVGTLPLVKL